MDTFELIERLAVALAIGLVIGIERGWKQREEPEGDRAAGLRTHALSGLLGGVWGALANLGAGAGLLMLGIAFAAFAAVVTVFRYREMVHDGTYGATTVVAALLAFSLGAFAVLGDKTAAAAAGIAAALLLALKAVLHEWVKRLSWEELRAGLVLGAMTVILLPLLPDRELTPWFPVRPREIWLLTILIAALSFAGYVAIRVAGPKVGVLLAGFAGGLVSSTAVTPTRPDAETAPAPDEPACWIGNIASTVEAVSGVPLWNITPSGSVIVHSVRSSLGAMSVASHGP